MEQTFFQRYGFRILWLVIFSLAFIWMGTRRTLESNSNNVADWLPQDYPETKEYKWFLQHFPYESFVIVSWKDCTLGDPDGKLETFAQKLVPEETIDNIPTWMTDVPRIQAEIDAPLPPLPEEAAGEPEESTVVVPHERDPTSTPTEAEETRYFKHVLTGPRLVRMLEDRYSSDPGSPLYVDRRHIIDRLGGVLISPDRTAADGTVLKPEQYQTALMVTLSKQYMGKELKKVLAEIRRIGAECGIQLEQPPESRPLVKIATDSVLGFFKELLYGRHVSTDGVILGGPPVDNVAIDYEGERTLVRLAGLCAVFGFVISYLCFRSIRLTMFVFWAAILSAGVAMALVTFTGSRCDAILLSMPALVYVLSMSGAIHIINYYHDTIREYGLKGAAERAIQHAWYPCSIASLTTAFGLISLYLASLLPIQKFGIYAALGVCGSLCLIFFYLPSLLHYYPSREYAAKYGGKGLKAEQDVLLLRFWRWFGCIIIRNNKVVALICVALMVLFGYGVFKIETSVKLMRFFAEDSEIITHYKWLEGRLGPLVPMEIVLCIDNGRIAIERPETAAPDGTPLPLLNSIDRMRLVEKICETIKREMAEEVGGVMSAATLGPPLGELPEPGTRRPARDAARDAAINRGINNARPLMREYVAIDEYSVTQTATGADGKQAASASSGPIPTFSLDNPERRTILAQMGLSEEDASRLRSAGIFSVRELMNIPPGQSVPGISGGELQTCREKANAWLLAHGTDLWRINLRVWSLKKDIDYAKFIDHVEKIVSPEITRFAEQRGLPVDAMTVRYTGMVKLVYKTQHELLKGLVESLFMAFVTIALVMMCVLKSPMAGLIAMIPNVFPVVIVFGFMGLSGILVDVGTMMTASVALGIAVDDTIHYLTWFREGIDRGLDAKGAAIEAYERCATAMTQTTLIGGLGLSAFAFSTFTPTQMFGIMMLSLLSVALMGDLIFLPAILTGPAGRFFRPGKKSETKKSEPANPTGDSAPVSDNDNDAKTCSTNRKSSPG